MGLRRMLVKMLDPAGNADGTKVVGIDAGRAAWVDLPTDAEAVRDVIGAALVAGSGVSIVVSDPGDTITISSTGGGGGGSTGKDRRWTPGAAETTVDEFNDDTLDAAWVRVDGTGAASGNLTIVEGADVVSLANNGGDTADVLHGLVRPLSGAGGSMAAGDGFVTCVTQLASDALNYSIGGLILADGTTIGSGKQVTASRIKSSTQWNANSEAYTNWNTRGSTNATITATMPMIYLRLALISAGSWRADVSPDGVTWIKGTAVSQSFTPTYVGFLSSSWGTSTKHVSSYEFLRRVSGVT